jgi:hypothetical protein
MPHVDIPAFGDIPRSSRALRAVDMCVVPHHLADGRRVHVRTGCAPPPGPDQPVVDTGQPGTPTITAPDPPSLTDPV